MKILKFEKENCPACQMVENFLQENNVQAEKVNPFENPELAVKYKITSVPVTFLLDDNENVVDKIVGFKPDKLEQMIEKLK
jgi:thioredoxin 1